MLLTHTIGPVGGVSRPSNNPLEIRTPRFFSGTRPEVYFVAPVGRHQNQEDKGSCVAHGHSKPVENVALASGFHLQVCRSDAYSMALFLDGNEGRDVGVQIATMSRVFEQYGILPEYVRPYKSDDVTRRTDPRYDAERMKGPTFSFLPKTVEAIQDALMVSGGVPYGQEVRSNFKPDAEGVVRVPSGTLGGYHETYFCGWSNLIVGGAFLCENSWANWGIDHPLVGIDPRFEHLRGKRGFAWFPYEWVSNSGFFDPVWVKTGVRIAA